MAKAIMVQGTGSHVGKSLITAGLCRIFQQEGFEVAPFKSQNMALNSFVTKDGKEIGRAQALQAAACRREPSAEMNPILLKPNGNGSSHMVIDGKFSENLTYAGFYEVRDRLWKHVEAAYEKLAGNHEVIVIEGAGSPAEINLMDREIVNMAVARHADCQVILVGDIDRGGLFASFIGTLELLEPKDRARIKGFVINKFRGDKSLLSSAIEGLEQRTGIPVLGVVDYMENLILEDEDSVTLEGIDKFSGNKSDIGNSDKVINITVIKLPLISNYTDFDSFKTEQDVTVKFASKPEHLNDADVIIIPGSKNTISDIKFLKARGLDKSIISQSTKGTLIVGICGGYQMLGHSISDPNAVESNGKKEEGLGLLDIITEITDEKETYQVKGFCTQEFSDKFNCKGEVDGYEIHMGRTTFTGKERVPFRLLRRGTDSQVESWDGAYSNNLNIFGTYIHGIFDNSGFRNSFLNSLRACKNMDLCVDAKPLSGIIDSEIDRLATVLRESLNMDEIFNLLDISKVKV